MPLKIQRGTHIACYLAWSQRGVLVRVGWAQSALWHAYGPLEPSRAAGPARQSSVADVTQACQAAIAGNRVAGTSGAQSPGAGVQVRSTSGNDPTDLNPSGHSASSP
eukprot:3937106-Rhodomonas_salina.1